VTAPAGSKRVVFLVQDEPLFIPGVCRTLAEGLADRLVAVGFFNPASSWKQFKREYLGRLRYYGLIDFCRIAALYLWRRLSRQSARRLLLEQRVPLIDWPSSSLRDAQLLEKLKELRPDILLVLGNQIVPKELLEVAADGCFNIHLSMLPRHRGREPVFHAFLAQDPSAGVTVHQMTKELDAGDIYAQASLPLTSGMTVLEANGRLWEMGAELFCRMVLDWEEQRPSPTAQDESKANYNRSFPDRDAVRRFRHQGGAFV
jgi:folate-dependent phosphoribosylglycinamide formyltransferase PurN